MPVLSGPEVKAVLASLLRKARLNMGICNLRVCLDVFYTLLKRGIRP